MKLGKTIVAERESVLTESERMQNREKEKRRKFLTTMSVIMLFAFVALAVVLVMSEVVQREKRGAETAEKTYEPTVMISNEDGRGVVTARIRQYVGRLEQDFYDLGRKVSRAVMPSGKLREIDIYLDGKDYYFKCNLDRGTAETAEDVMRMERYLDKNEIVPEKYVDVRVEGKAYYL